MLLHRYGQQFAEAVKLDYLPEGLVYQLETTLDQIEEKSLQNFLRAPIPEPEH